MQNLIQFILRYHAFLMFVALELLCLVLMVRFNANQRSIFFSSANHFSGYAYENYYAFSQYLNLAAVADSLAKENSLLYEQLDNSKYNAQVVSDTALVDSIYKQQYFYMAAKVVNNSSTLQNNYLTLDRGAKHGVKRHRGVISGSGLLGVVVNVSEHYSLVMSLLHRQTKISARIKRNGELGSLVWRGNDARYMQLEAVPKHVELAKGDTVLTSGFSTMFPEGLLVGTIASFHIEGGSNFYNIDVKLSNNIRATRHVQIIENIMQTEQEALEKQVNTNE